LSLSLFYWCVAIRLWNYQLRILTVTTYMSTNHPKPKTNYALPRITHKTEKRKAGSQNEGKSSASVRNVFNNTSVASNQRTKHGERRKDGKKETVS